MASRVTIYESGLVRAMQTDGRDWNLKKAREVEAVAIVRAPKRSGRLARSHGTEQNRSRLGRYQTGFTVFADAPYAGYVHGGTGPYVAPPGVVMGPLPAAPGMPRFIRSRRGQAAQPWLQEAADAVL